MTAHRLSFADWQSAVMADLRTRIERLADEAADTRRGSTHDYLCDARAAWCAGDAAEVERLLTMTSDVLTREREWAAEHAARYGAR